jgi:hypothetical protein
VEEFLRVFPNKLKDINELDVNSFDDNLKANKVKVPQKIIENISKFQL